MKAKGYIAEQFPKREKYSFDKIKSLLDESLEALAFWIEEANRHAEENEDLRKQVAALRRKLDSVQSVPPGVARLPFSGIVK